MNAPDDYADDAPTVPDVDTEKGVRLEETEWNEKTEAMRQILLRMNDAADALIKKGRIKTTIPTIGKMWILFEAFDVLVERIGKPLEELKKYYPALHPFYGSTAKYHEFNGFFDLKGNIIERAAKSMLAELETANNQESTEEFKFSTTWS